MNELRYWDPDRGAIIATATPSPERIGAFSWDLTSTQDAAIKRASIADARAFGRAATWPADRREQYLRDLKQRMAEPTGDELVENVS